MQSLDIVHNNTVWLMIGDFIQLSVTTGRDLWSVMYGTVSGNDDTARNLFQQFCVKELTVNI